MTKKYFLAIMLAGVAFAHAQENEGREKELEEVVISSQTIFPDRDANERASSHFHLGKKDIKKYNYADPNRILMGKNGISIVEEDGFGLRPNIIIRGASSYRSMSINLMEDGVLAAPAPYIAPAAYYFPTMARMAGVEILKSSGQILYGPNTVGGSMNLISTQVPKSFSGNANLAYGSFDTKNVHLNIGDRIGKFGYLVEYYNASSDGFKKLPNNKNTGFNLNDGMIKLLYDNSDATIPSKLQFKLQFSKQLDNETYMGLTKADFEADPLQRYMASELDQMRNNHRSYLLSYEIEPLKKLTLNFDVYHNEFNRNWHKVNDIQVGTASKVGLSAALNKGQNSDEVAVLKGLYSGDNTVYVRNNNRAYYSQGIQMNSNYQVTKNGKIRFGARYHREEEDRFQADDKYRSTQHGLSLKSIGIGGSQTNRVSNAEAFASYLQYQHKLGDFTFTGGFRYEDISMKETRYAGNDPERKTPTKVTENENKVFIPGASILYNFNKAGAIFASVHKGFAPSGIKEGQKAENSWNYELGMRWNDNHLDAEVSGYINDYSNLLGADTNAVGGATGQGDLYNAGAVLVKGVEAYLKYTINGKDSDVNFPVSVNYTYFDSSFKNDYESKAEVYGKVKKGDKLPYIPTHMLTGELGANINKFSFSAVMKYRGDIRNKVGQGKILDKDLVPSVILLDAVVRYQMTPYANVFVTGQNLLNKKYLATLNPAGYRPGMPLFFSVGTSIKF